MKFGVHNPSWLFGHDPAEAFEAVTAKVKWADLPAPRSRHIRLNMGRGKIGFFKDLSPPVT
jgi:hypothetical protein